MSFAYGGRKRTGVISLAFTVLYSFKEKVCLTCGAIGFQEAIITCFRCKDFQVHQYCELGYCEDPPEDWCCEVCVIGNGIMSSSHVLENEHSNGSKLHAPAKVCHNTVPPKKRRNFRGGNCLNNWEKEVQTGKTRYLPVKEAIFLSSGVKKYGSPVKITGSSRPVAGKSMATVSQVNLNKPRAQVINFSPEKSTVQHSIGAAGYLKPQSLRNTQATELTKTPVQLSKGRGDSTIAELRSTNAVNASQMVIPPRTHPCDPALVPSWKGSFDIFGDIKLGMLNNQIQAHPSSRVKRKVYEFSGNLPDTLQFDLVPRRDIWTSLFNNNCAGKEDIGLYFFASEGERSEIYIKLVEFMRIKDLVMRTVIKGVELLVLASTVLCSDSQRWNSEYFLWGLFHRIRKDTTGCAEGGCNEVIDMEIDMIGGEDYHTTNEVDMEIDMIAGENVGRVDIFVPTTTSRNGFGSSLKDAVTAVICDPSESVTPLASISGEELPQEDIKREPVDDFPPGFIPHSTPN